MPNPPPSPVERREHVPFIMAIENVELMNVELVHERSLESRERSCTSSIFYIAILSIRKISASYFILAVQVGKCSRV